MPGVDFEALLREAIGLDAASLGPSAVARAVQRRQSACKLADRHNYWLLLRSSPNELQELIEAVVVPETWFFRDPQAFAALAGMARAELIGNPARTELRLLSLPCSTGEEPFSMAMALLDAGIAAHRFRIDAVDISLRALEQAGRASYGPNSFRAQDLDFRTNHFEPVDGRWQPSAAVRQSVKFQQGNLFAPDFLPGQGIYDYIFCRNVVIYFDPPTQARTLEVLLRLLTPGGCLFVGPSETGLLPRDRLVSAQLPMAFAFRRVETPKPAAPVLDRRAPVADRRAPMLRSAKAAAQSRPQRQPVPPNYTGADRRVLPQDGNEAALSKVQQLANSGLLAEAAAACEEILKDFGPSAPAYHLLGLVRDAAGQPDAAVALYRKALYLHPERQETLAHLALLLEKQGQRAAARVLRERLKRLEAQAEP